MEFVLAMPFLFFLFFCLLQVFYTAFAALAVQRASLALARESSLTGEGAGSSFLLRLYTAMGPLASLNKVSLVSLAATTHERRISPDGSDVTVLVRYPMPIWVPLAGRVFGEKLSPEALRPKGLTSTLKTLEGAGLFFPDPWPDGIRLPYFRWVAFESRVHHEGKP